MITVGSSKRRTSGAPRSLRVDEQFPGITPSSESTEVYEGINARGSRCNLSLSPRHSQHRFRYLCSQTRNFRVGFEYSQTHDNPDRRYKPIGSRPRTVLFLTSQLWRKEVSFLFSKSMWGASETWSIPLGLFPSYYRNRIA
jgi:hypothetical protein